MKKAFRILALALVVVMLSAMAVSCGAEKVSATVKISIAAGEDVILNGIEITVEGTTEQPPSVLQAIREALITYEIPFTDDGASIVSIQDYAETNDELNLYFWEYTINGAAPKSGKAIDNIITDGMEISYIYSSMAFNPDKI